MVKTTFILCVSVVLLAIHPSQGSFCTKKGYYYAAQNYCTNYSWWSMWCWSTAYRRIQVADHWRECCPGYKGKDCTTPICLEPCGPGYICSSPDMCTIDPLALNNLYLNGTDTNSTSSNSTNSTSSNSTNSTSSNSTDVGVSPYQIVSQNGTTTEDPLQSDRQIDRVLN